MFVDLEKSNFDTELKRWTDELNQMDAFFADNPSFPLPPVVLVLNHKDSKDATKSLNILEVRS